MDTNGALSREKAVRRAEVRASIGRALKDFYEAHNPLPDRLIALVRTIKESAGDRQAGDASSDPV